MTPSTIIILFISLISSTVCFLPFNKRMGSFRQTFLQSRLGRENNDHLLTMYLDSDSYKSGIMTTNDFENYWNLIRSEANDLSGTDIKATAILSNAVLSHHSLSDAIMDYVSSHLESAYLSSAQIRNIFAETRDRNSNISSLWAMDLMASSLRDKMLPNSMSTLLFSKGYHALVTHRIASALWYSGRDGLARYIQSTGSRVFNIDIHPACKVGARCFFSSGAGMVIGETSVIGDDCSISHSVTLGSNGKESGNRHPKLGRGVYLAPMSTLLGNIPIGDGCVVNAGSVVTKPVESYTRVGGVPAKFISKHSPEEVESLQVGKSSTQDTAELDHDHHFFI